MVNESGTTSRFLVSDEQWSCIQPLLPVPVNTHRFGGGKPRRADRDCLNGIFFVLRTGCQWKALDATDICPGSTAHDRFQEWVKAGVFQRLWQAGLLAYDQVKGLNWSWLSMDGAMTKAPLGGKKNGEKPDRSRQGRRQAVAALRSARNTRGIGDRRRQPA